MKKILAWHFLHEPKLPHGDRREVCVGSTLSVALPLVICQHGLHGSRRILDALSYAPGNLLCRTEHSGDIQTNSDKLCSQHRKVIWMGDIANLLHEFACREAELALAARRKEGYTISVACDNAIKTKRLWLQGKATSEELSTAWSAAESAARSTAWSAAESAAWSAARSTAWSAAESAAWSAAESAARSTAWSAAWRAAWRAARSAAWSAAWSAAESAAWSAAESAAESTAWSAAWRAAWSAAESAQNIRLERMIRKFMKENPVYIGKITK